MTSLFVYLSLSVPSFHFPFVICLPVFLSLSLSVISPCLWLGFISLSPCLPVSLPPCLSVFLSICLSISQYIFVHLSICPVSLYLCVSFCLSLSFCLYCLTDCPYVFLSLFSIRLSLCLSVSVFYQTVLLSMLTIRQSFCV